MSLAALTGTSIVVPDHNDGDEGNIDNDNDNYARDASARIIEPVAVTMDRPMDRQPMAPRRSISPQSRRAPTKDNDSTLKSANNFQNNNSDDDCSIDEDLDTIDQLYGGHVIGEAGISEEISEYLVSSPASPKTSGHGIPPPLPPPLRNINGNKEDNKTPYRLFGKVRHAYDRTRQPGRSSMRKPNSQNRNVHSIDNSNSNKRAVTRGVSRNHSADGTEDTRRGSGSLHSIRMRGSVYPVHRRQSIGFEETVSIQEVTPTVELNDGNTRDLWLQADEAMEIKERRRGLLKRYKEREAKKKQEAERLRKEREKVEREQKVKSLLNSSKTHFVSPHPVTKKQTRWSGMSGMMGGKKSDLPIPAGDMFGHRSSRWKSTIQTEHPSVMGLSVPSRGSEDRSSNCSINLDAATSSFMSGSSGGSSFSGHDSDSFRGLEKYVDRSGKHQKNMVWDAVFIEQDEQLQFGYYDDERIATLYQTVQNQHDGQQKAVGRARKDRKAADSYLNTPRTMKLLKKTINVSDVKSLQCGALLDDDHDNNHNNNNDTDKDNTNNSNIGNHGKTDDKDNNNDTTNDDTKASPTLEITVLKSSGSSGDRIKSHKKYLRRLSV